MKIPEKIAGQNKVRDAKIILLYASGQQSMSQIANRYGITQQRVQAIIYRNRALLVYDQAFEKTKRVAHLNRLLKKHDNRMGKKTTLDIIDQLRSEVEGSGNGSQSVGRGDTRVIIIRETTAALPQPPQERSELNRLEVGNGDQDPSGGISRSVSVIRV